jgi:hypothetical protein
MAENAHEHRDPMKLDAETIGAVLGAALASAGTVVVGARRWMSKPSEKKLDALSLELGVGVGPSLASLVMATASTVQRLEGSSMDNGRGIDQILQVQEAHGEKLNGHEERIETIEAAHVLASKTEEVAAALAAKTELTAKNLAAKAESVAASLATKTERTAKELVDKQEGGTTRHADTKAEGKG